MGDRDKLLEPVDGQTLLRRQTLIALATGCPVAVCLPPKPGLRRDAIEGLPVTQINVPDAAEGLGATLRTAAFFATHQDPDRAMMILLPDVPDINPSDIKLVLSTFENNGTDTPTRASNAKGRPGTPLIVPARLLPAFTRLTGDDGGKSVLKAEPVTLVRLQDARAIQDLDTPEDWTAWREKTGIAS